MGEQGEKRIDSPEEIVPFLIVVDCEAKVDDETQMLPFAEVLEEIKQALAARSGMQVRIAHVSIREAREDILHAVDAASDEEDRRRG